MASAPQYYPYSVTNIHPERHVPVAFTTIHPERHVPVSITEVQVHQPVPVAVRDRYQQYNAADYLGWTSLIFQLVSLFGVADWAHIHDQAGIESWLNCSASNVATTYGRFAPSAGPAVDADSKLSFGLWNMNLETGPDGLETTLTTDVLNGNVGFVNPDCISAVKFARSFVVAGNILMFIGLMMKPLKRWWKEFQVFRARADKRTYLGENKTRLKDSGFVELLKYMCDLALDPEQAADNLTEMKTMHEEAMREQEGRQETERSNRQTFFWTAGCLFLAIISLTVSTVFWGTHTYRDNCGACDQGPLEPGSAFWLSVAAPVLAFFATVFSFVKGVRSIQRKRKENGPTDDPDPFAAAAHWDASPYWPPSPAAPAVNNTPPFW